MVSSVTTGSDVVVVVAGVVVVIVVVVVVVGEGEDEVGTGVVVKESDNIHERSELVCCIIQNIETNRNRRICSENRMASVALQNKR